MSGTFVPGHKGQRCPAAADAGGLFPPSVAGQGHSLSKGCPVVPPVSPIPRDAAQLAFDLFKACEARDTALARVETHHADIVRVLRAAAKVHAQQHGRVHVDDVRKIAAARGMTVAKNAWGAIFRGPGWRKVGERPSALVSNKGHVSPEWTWDEQA
jgi:hypothetical protein